jgi:hypothetical protein
MSRREAGCRLGLAAGTIGSLLLGGFDMMLVFDAGTIAGALVYHFIEP